MSTITLPTPSAEQQVIIDTASGLTTNIMVDAVAGSGKTTLCMHIAQQLEGSRVLILTYNKDLKAESRARAESLGLTNVEVHTYHSLCYKYYGSQDYTDEGIKNSIANAHLSGYAGINGGAGFRLIVLDESQDVTDLLFQLFVRFYTDINGAESGIPVMLIGDKYQTIYQFKGADARYLTRAPEKYNLNALPWVQLNMHESFRITREIAKFVNRSMLGADRLVARKHGPRVIYACMNVFRKGSLNSYLNGCRDDEIMLFALANFLSQGGRKVYAPVSDDTVPDRRDMNGKVAVLTFHQSKGLERRVVLVFSFDAKYFEFYERHGDPHMCPNIMYVACTRAKEKLVVLHDVKNGPLPFLNTVAVHADCDVRGTITETQAVTRAPILDYTVTRLCSHLSFDQLLALRASYTVEHIEKDGVWDTIGVNDVIYTKFTEPQRIETVSEITGTAVPLMFAYVARGKLYDVLDGCECIVPAAKKSSTHAERMDYVLDRVPRFLEQANLYIAHVSGYVHKVNQIASYNWMKPEDAREALERLGAHISEDAVFESKYTYTQLRDGEVAYTVTGRSDCVDNDILWEFKFTSSLQAEHIIQLALYAMLTECSHSEYRLYNVKTGEMMRLTNVDLALLREMSDKLVDIKISDTPEIAESEFLRKKKLPTRPPAARQSDLDMFNDL
jgi:hypothetical protein